MWLKRKFANWLRSHFDSTWSEKQWYRRLQGGEWHRLKASFRGTPIEFWTRGCEHANCCTTMYEIIEIENYDKESAGDLNNIH